MKTKYLPQIAAICGFIGISPLPLTVAQATGENASQIGVTPVAMVIDVDGTTVPVLAAHQEIGPGARVELAPNAQISILHYKACSIFTVKGGSVNITEGTVDVTAGKVESKAGPCPRVHRVVAAGLGTSGGAIVVRTVPRPPARPAADGVQAHLAANEEIVLAGTKAAAATVAEVLDSKGGLVEGPMQVRNAAIRLAGSRLVPGDYYVLSIRLQGESEPVRIPFFVSRLPNDGSFILRLE